MIPLQKPCKACGVVKPFSDFERNPKTRTGIGARCRACANISSLAWKAKDRAIRAAERAKLPKKTTGNADPLNYPIDDVALARYWSYVNKTETCWLWTGRTRNGYGSFYLAKGERQVHRLALRIAGQELLPHLVVDHLCKVKRCVRPDHLRQVTQRVNALVGESQHAKNARKVACIRGHPFTPENTHWKIAGPWKRPTRDCIACYALRRPGSMPLDPRTLEEAESAPPGRRRRRTKG